MLSFPKSSFRISSLLQRILKRSPQEDSSLQISKHPIGWIQRMKTLPKPVLRGSLQRNPRDLSRPSMVNPILMTDLHHPWRRVIPKGFLILTDHLKVCGRWGISAEATLNLKWEWKMANTSNRAALTPSQKQQEKIQTYQEAMPSQTRSHPSMVNLFSMTDLHPLWKGRNHFSITIPRTRIHRRVMLLLQVALLLRAQRGTL